ncbi:MAG: TetR family transcriptional regulator [Myxococcales bacterium]|nr:TetR family transcriptional regulator [Myxococcales bacterium]
MQAPSTLRERKKAQTREALAEAALELFAARGFEAVTVDEITGAADVSRRTFFRYFPTKEAVVFPHHGERLARFRENLRRGLGEGTPFEAVRGALLALAREYMANRREMVFQQRIIETSPGLIARERELDLQWETAIAETLARGETDDGRARILAGALMGAARAMLREWFAADGRSDLVRMGDEALDLIERGAESSAPWRRTLQ